MAEVDRTRGVGFVEKQESVPGICLLLAIPPPTTDPEALLFRCSKHLQVPHLSDNYRIREEGPFPWTGHRVECPPLRPLNVSLPSN